MLRKLSRVSTAKFVNGSRFISAQTARKLEDFVEPNTQVSASETEWTNAKPFKDIPGPSRTYFMLNSLPGGKFHNLPLKNLHEKLYNAYGPIILLKGLFGKPDTVVSYDPESFAKVFRTEGEWPVRQIFDSMLHYRKELRSDVYNNFIGLTLSQGKAWADIRSMVNPIMLKPKNVNLYIPGIDKISAEFIERIKELRDPNTLEVPGNFDYEANRWSLESIGLISLDTRLGLMDNNIPSEKAEKLIRTLRSFFELILKVEFQPIAVWKYFPTPTYKKTIDVYNVMTDIGFFYVKEAKKRLENEKRLGLKTSDSMFAQFLESTKSENIAMIMALDLLLAGVDTTASAFLTTLYFLAKNPEVQARLREEAVKTLPTKDAELTEERMKNLPYMRAVIKEVQRVSPVSGGALRETTQNIVLNGYRIPKHTVIVMSAQTISKRQEYIEDGDKFLPERWLREDQPGSCPDKKFKNPFAYIPFGFGPRMCVGKRIAQLELETVLLKIVRNFNVEWHHPDVGYRTNIINSIAGDLKFKFVDTKN